MTELKLSPLDFIDTESRSSLVRLGTDDCKKSASMWDPHNKPPSTKEVFCTFLEVVFGEIFTGLMIWGIFLANGIWAGSLGDPTMLAAVGLAGATIQILVMYPVNTFAYGQDNFSGQAFGAGDLQLCGLWLNRGFLVLTCLFVPIAFIPAFFAEDMFLAIGQNPTVAKLTA